MNSGGAQFVAVIKTGANQVHSSLLYALENKKFQSDNLDDNLRSTGLTIADKFTRLSEFNGDIGGPFMKDKFWYYTSYRHEYVGLQTRCVRTTVSGMFCRRPVSLLLSAANCRAPETIQTERPMARTSTRGCGI